MSEVRSGVLRDFLLFVTVAANLKYFRTFVFYKVASVGETQLYQTSDMGGYFTGFIY